MCISVRVHEDIRHKLHVCRYVYISLSLHFYGMKQIQTSYSTVIYGLISSMKNMNCDII